jgi:nucleoside-diphosphate-sugar epimerase
MPVRALVQSTDEAARLRAAGLDVVVGDVRDAATLGAATCGVHTVVHCAARTGPWGPAHEYQTTNVDALETLVRVAVAGGVRRIVHVSSVTVHGNDIGGTADETAPFRVEPNPYSRSKVAGELLLQRLVDEAGAPVVVVRPGYMYGPGDVTGFARFATRIRTGRMVIIGGGDNHIPLVHVRDVARGVLQAADAGSDGRAYLLVNDEPVTQRGYLDAIAEHLGAPRPRRRVPYGTALLLGKTCELGAHLLRRAQPPPLMEYGVRVLGGENRFDISRARAELGFAPRIAMRAGVRESVEWFEASREPHSPARAR